MQLDANGDPTCCTGLPPAVYPSIDSPPDPGLVFELSGEGPFTTAFVPPDTWEFFQPLPSRAFFLGPDMSVGRFRDCIGEGLIFLDNVGNPILQTFVGQDSPTGPWHWLTPDDPREPYPPGLAITVHH